MRRFYSLMLSHCYSSSYWWSYKNLFIWSGNWKLRPTAKSDTYCYPKRDLSNFSKEDNELLVSFFFWRIISKACESLGI